MERGLRNFLDYLLDTFDRKCHIVRMAHTKKVVTVNVRIEKPLKKELDIIAKREERTFAQIVRIALRRYTSVVTETHLKP